jgi:hypothetical protein
LICGGLVLLAGIWIVVTGLLARSQLQSVRAEVHQLRSQLTGGDLAAAQKTLSALQSHAHHARLLTAGPVWAVAAAIPDGGEPLHTIRVITASTDRLASSALPTLIDTRRNLDPSKLRRSDGSVDIGRIAAAAPALDRATSELSGATDALTDATPHTWLASADHARADLLGELQRLDGPVRAADIATHVAPPMLGANGTQRYFVGFQNDAESRGTGGLPGAFGILQVSHGKAHFERFENDSRLGTVPTGLDFGADYDQLYQGAATTSLYVNSNLSPHFPYAAQIWTAMWRKVSGQRLDGAIAVDPTALSYLLGVTGPVKLPDGSQIDSGNVVAQTESQVYARFRSDTAGRKQYLLDVARAVGRDVVALHGSASSLVKAAARAAGERRLLVWSAQPALETQLMRTSLAGAIPSGKRPYAGLAVVNEAGNKLDYYLDRSLRWQRSGCGRTQTVTATITLTNNAPATGLPAYVMERNDRPTYPVKPGDNRLDVYYFATQDAVLESVTVDGRPAATGSGLAFGHPVYVLTLEMPRGVARTIVLRMSEPGDPRSPTILNQPLVRPLTVAVDDARCA